MTDRQSQQGGANSTNIQAQTVVVGLSYSEVRDVALDVFRENFLILRDLAMSTAEDRARVFIERLIAEMQSSSGSPPESMGEPAMQSALYEAQKAYALSGDEVLSDVLVRLLVDRAGNDDKDLAQVVQQQALEVVPKLTTPQIHTLAVLFTILRAHFTNNQGILASAPVQLWRLALPVLQA